MSRSNDSTAGKRAAARYNMLPNLLWSAVAFVPLTVYAYAHYGVGQVLLSLALALLPFLFPNAAFDALRLGRSAAAYRRLGVGLVQRLSQNGTWVNDRLRRRYPGYRAVRPGERSVAALVRQTFLFEKFHWGLLLVFGCAATLALYEGDAGWALAFVAINVFYNAYPVLLQQYLRTRLGWQATAPSRSRGQ